MEGESFSLPQVFVKKGFTPKDENGVESQETFDSNVGRCWSPSCFLRRFVDDRSALLEDRLEVEGEFLFIDPHVTSLQVPDENIADVVIFDDGLRLIPIGCCVEQQDVVLAGAVQVVPAAPLGFVTGPAHDGGIARKGGYPREVAVTSADGFGYDSLGLGLQKLDPGGIVGVIALDAGEVVEVVAEGWFEILGLGHQAEGWVKQTAEDDQPCQQTETDVCEGKSAQGLGKAANAKRRGETPQHPRLIVELEDGVDAIAELVAQEDEFGREDEQGGEGDEEENKG